ncbi:MAG: GIY-YIG nuclease family protein [bacterium]|nr:GIY-YIG nuclease family protein [bacterium]
MPVWTVYITYSDAWDRYYTGVTDTVERRLQEHNHGFSPSTKGGAPWTLKHTEEFTTIEEAYQREQFIKRKKSRKILEKIALSPDVRLERSRDPDNR